MHARAVPLKSSFPRIGSSQGCTGPSQRLEFHTQQLVKGLMRSSRSLQVRVLASVSASSGLWHWRNRLAKVPTAGAGGTSSGGLTASLVFPDCCHAPARAHPVADAVCPAFFHRRAGLLSDRRIGQADALRGHIHAITLTRAISPP